MTHMMPFKSSLHVFIKKLVGNHNERGSGHMKADVIIATTMIASTMIDANIDSVRYTSSAPILFTHQTLSLAAATFSDWLVNSVRITSYHELVPMLFSRPSLTQQS